MLEQEYKNPGGRSAWYCNPERNPECDKTFCKHNINAMEPLCEATTKKKFALKKGQKAEKKAYTPGQNK